MQTELQVASPTQDLNMGHQRYFRWDEHKSSVYLGHGKTAVHVAEHVAKHVATHDVLVLS